MPMAKEQARTTNPNRDGDVTGNVGKVPFPKIEILLKSETYYPHSDIIFLFAD